MVGQTLRQDTGADTPPRYWGRHSQDSGADTLVCRFAAEIRADKSVCPTVSTRNNERRQIGRNGARTSPRAPFLLRMLITPARRSMIRRRLLAWFAAHARPLPWRSDR